MAIDLLADTPEGIDLLADEPTIKTAAANNQSFYNLSKEDQAKAMKLAHQQLSAQYPNMPGWLRDMILSVTPKDRSPMLEKAGNVAQNVSSAINVAPVAAGGLLEGFSTPFRGIASMLPGETAENFAKAAPYTDYVPAPQNDVERGLQDVAKLAGSFSPLAKMFGALKTGTQLAGVPKVLQNASALAGTGAIATPGDTDDKALGAAGAVALGGAGKVAGKIASTMATKVPAFLRGLVNESTPQALVEAVQKPHDVLSNTADRLYGYVKKAIKDRNISIPVKPEYIKQAEDILPNTRASKKLIRDAQSGDYNAVHDLQSHLYKKGTKGLASEDVANENQGEEILDLRNKINDDVKDHLIQSGHVDIAHVLEQGKGVYKKLMDTYFNKNLPKGIHKLVQSDLRLVPKNPEKLFSQNSKPMTKFLQQHPEASKHLKGVLEKQASQKALKGMAVKGGVLGGLTYGGKSISDLL